MPGQDQYVKLPDGTYVHVPGSATPQQLSQLRDKLSSLQPNLKTGQGMEVAAHRQATPKPGELPGVPSGPPPTGNAGTAQAPLITPQPGEGIADTMRRGVEMGRRVTPRQIGTATDTGIREAPAVIAAASAPSMVTGIAEGVAGGAPGILRLARGLTGAMGGAYLGRKSGEAIGGDTGGTLGEFAGGLAGGGLAAGLERQPATSLQSRRGVPGSINPLPFGIQRFIPEWMVPKGEVGSPTNPGPFNDIPMRMPRTAGRAMELPGATGGTSSVAGTRSLVLTPSEAASEDVMQGIAKRRASERGMQFAGGMTPREGRSVPKLPSQMQEEELPGPREVVHFPDDDDEQK